MSIKTKRRENEAEFLENVIGETEMISDYDAETVLDSVKGMCQQRFAVVEPQSREDKIRQKMQELLELVPDDGHLAITGFDMNELAVYKKKDIGVYSPVVKLQDPKIQG